MVPAMQYMFCNTSHDNVRVKLNKIAWIYFLCVVHDIELYGALGNVGGHALFASLSQLQDLWHNEIVITQLLENMVEKFEKPPPSVIK